MGGIAGENNKKNYGNWIKFGEKSVAPNTANWFPDTFRSLALTAAGFSCDSKQLNEKQKQIGWIGNGQASGGKH